MLSTLAVSDYILPPPAFPFSIDEGPRCGQEDVPAMLAALAKSLAEGRMANKEQSDQFDVLYCDIEKAAIEAEEIEQLAEEIFRLERQKAANLLPKIEKLERNLATFPKKPRSPVMRSWRRIAAETLDGSRASLELYGNLRIRLLKLASDLRGRGDLGSPIFSDAESAVAHLRKLIAE